MFERDRERWCLRERQFVCEREIERDREKEMKSEKKRGKYGKKEDRIVREIDRQYQSDVRQSNSGSQTHEVDKQGQGTR